MVHQGLYQGNQHACCTSSRVPSRPHGAYRPDNNATCLQHRTGCCAQATAAVRRDLCQRLGSKSPAADFLTSLAARMAPSLMPPEVLRAALRRLAADSDSQPSSSAAAAGGGVCESVGLTATYQLVYNMAKARLHCIAAYSLFMVIVHLVGRVYQMDNRVVCRLGLSAYHSMNSIRLPTASLNMHRVSTPPQAAPLLFAGLLPDAARLLTSPAGPLRTLAALVLARAGGHRTRLAALAAGSRHPAAEFAPAGDIPQVRHTGFMVSQHRASGALILCSN